MISSQIQWNQTPRGSWCEEEFRSQSETRKTVYLAQTGKFGKAVNRSVERQIKEEKT